MNNPREALIYFDNRHMGEPSFDYVCWLDTMGTRNAMLRSLPTAANFVFKLHCAVLQAHEASQSPDILLYPVMDGVYIASSSKRALMNLLAPTLSFLATNFIAETTLYHRFLVRGAIAFGPIFHGCSVGKDASWVLDRHAECRDSVLLGIPIAQAYNAESSAPPYGIAVDESARAFAPPGDRPFPFIWWNWFRDQELDTAEMLSELDRYFDWHRAHTFTTGYEEPRIAHHQALAREYFAAP